MRDMARTEAASQARNGVLASLLLLLWAVAAVVAPPPAESGEVRASVATFSPKPHARTSPRPSRAEIVDHRRSLVLQRPDVPSPAPGSADGDLDAPWILALTVSAWRRQPATPYAPPVPAAPPRAAVARAPPHHS
jgi:hypothetical protein